MNDDIIRMARERDLIEMDHDCLEGVPLANLPELIELVRADERRACLEIADDCAESDMHASMAANSIRARSNT